MPHNLGSMSVRVRYAPSPTGSPHVGNIRTALYNHLFAKRHGGTNLLRLEDTDRARRIEGCEVEIMESMRYVGIEWQEGYGAGGQFEPYQQSERNLAGLYRPHWERLLEQGDAYWAFETPEELEEMRKGQERAKQATGYFGGAWRDATGAQVEEAKRQGKPGVIRLKIPRGEQIVVDDAIRGAILYDSNLLDDPVLIKADGMPTYHFAAMVDDHLMEITHIFRGEEWIGSAPKHVVLFKALGWQPPVMVHLPVIKGKDGSKLSKRHGDTACLDFRRAGYLGSALANFIALIGWSPGGDREVMSMDEMAEAFDLRGLQPSSGVFDMDKLSWMQGVHVRQADVATLTAAVLDYAGREETQSYWSGRIPAPGEPDPHVRLHGLGLLKDAPLEKSMSAVTLVKDRVTTLADFGEACAFVFAEPTSYEAKGAEKWFGEATTKPVLDLTIQLIEAQKPMDAAGFEAVLRDVQSRLGLEKMGPVVHPVRLATTGKTTGPGLFELMDVLGADQVVSRLRAAQNVVG